MPNVQMRPVVVSGIVGTVVGALGLTTVGVGITLAQHPTASQVSQWPLGVLFAMFLGGQMGAAMGVALALARQGFVRQASWLCLGGGIYIASFWWSPFLMVVFRALLAGRGIARQLPGLLYGAALGGPLLAFGLAFLLKARRSD